MGTAVNMPKEMTTAVLAVMEEFGSLKKEGWNQHGKFHFAKVDDFYNRIQKLLPKHGLLLLANEEESELIPMTIGPQDRDGNTIGGKTTIWVKTKWTFRLCHNGVTYSDGLCRFVTVPTSGPHTEGIAQSYASKNFMRDLFKVATGEYELDDMQPEPHGVPETNTEPETVEVAQEDESTVARRLYEQIVSPDFTYSQTVDMLNKIDRTVSAAGRSKVLRAAVDAREIGFTAKSLEDITKGRVSVGVVRGVGLSTTVLETALDVKEAELRAKAVPSAE